MSNFKRNLSIVLCMTLVACFGLSTGAWTDVAEASTLSVTIYEHSNYGGSSQVLTPGSYNVDDLSIGNDELTSLRVPTGLKVTLYEHSNWEGDKSIYYMDNSNVGDDWNDETSSIKVESISTGEGMPLDQYNTDAGKSQLIDTYAPRIWFARNAGTNELECYRPSSVEWAFPNLTRYRNSDGKYWLKTKETLDSPSTILDFFAGNIASAPVYSYIVEKNNNMIDIVYFVYYPYNRGKVIAGTYFGNHVGDWEHITVRLTKVENNGVTYVVPIQVYLSAHNFGGAYEWDDLSKEQTTHPVVYAAWGSHGFWKDSGNHEYANYVFFSLVDVCNQGLAWDTWNNTEKYFYNESRGIGTTEWPAWMSTDYSNSGTGDPSDPASGPIYRWGNEQMGSSYFGQYRLEDGPTGPPDKGVWDLNSFE
ncbi:Vps62-related protein [Vallitalea okinawensis]|uniref:Vps62-related protein n=1 Tax=Vallitalea okinawensis TaxID=2078660 RepID=UPI0013006210|nr:Vps62-related protein [Vallitalea okinawensis]